MKGGYYSTLASTPVIQQKIRNSLFRVGSDAPSGLPSKKVSARCGLQGVLKKTSGELDDLKQFRGRQPPLRW